MKTRIISTTLPHIWVDQNNNECTADVFGARLLSAEELTIYIARVSNPSNQTNTDTAPKLLAYCIRNGHWSVFEHVHMTIEIETSLAIATQILRHRSFTFQQFSQRYADVSNIRPSELTEPIDLRWKNVAGNRQGSGPTCTDRIPNKKFEDAVEESTYAYRQLLADGVAPESARFVLPQCTTTRLYMTGNLRSWIHYLTQRLDPHTQKEHREVAESILGHFKGQFPMTYEACVSIEIPAKTLFPSKTNT
jgi:thymidylate synthase (FAD)